MADTTYSWLQIVNAADPERNKQPVVYEFGNGKIKFEEPVDPYN